MQNDNSASFSVLISLPEDGIEEQKCAILGKTRAQRQLEFALELGCSQLILQGSGISTRAVSLKQQAEACKMGVQTTPGSHALAGALSGDDRLLVLSPDLVPGSAEAVRLLSQGLAVLTLPAEAGIPAGFERIDRERAWAGALVMQGALVSRLFELPEDSDPQSALLRIALQAGVPERRLDQSKLAEGSWAAARSNAERGAAEERWTARFLPEPPRFALARRAGHAIARRLAPAMLVQAAAVPAIIGSAVALLGASLVAPSLGGAALSFAFLLLSVLVLETGIALAKLRAAPFRKAGGLRHLRLAVDVTLLAAGAFAIGGDWHRQLFPPLMLLVALHLPPQGSSFLPSLLRDRAVIAAILVAGAALGVAELTIMALALALFAAKAAIRMQERG